MKRNSKKINTIVSVLCISMLIRFSFHWLNNIFFFLAYEEVQVNHFGGSICVRMLCRQYKVCAAEVIISLCLEIQLYTANQIKTFRCEMNFVTQQKKREEYNTKYRFVLTRKGLDRITHPIVTKQNAFSSHQMHVKHALIFLA